MNYRLPLEIATQSALMAGEILKKEFYNPDKKPDMDEKAETEMYEMLIKEFPSFHFRGEETGFKESKKAGEDKIRRGKNHEIQGEETHCWLVDPHNGTSTFMKGIRGSSVSIALLREGIPVLGVVYSYNFPDDQGDLFTWAEGCELKRNGNIISIDKIIRQRENPRVILVCRYADLLPEENLLLSHPYRYRTIPGMAYRLALVSAGEGLAGVSLNSPQGWDYAGGHALLKGMGGILIDQDGNEITYTKYGESRVSHCFGGVREVVLELKNRAWKKIILDKEEKENILTDKEKKVVLIDKNPISKERENTRLAHKEKDSPYDPILFPIRPPRPLAHPGILKRAQGCMLGQLTGDSLGSLVEFKNKKRIKELYPHGIKELADGGTFSTLAGQPTDDSEMALMLARSIIREGKYHPIKALMGYHFWYGSVPFDMGFTTSQVLGSIREDMENPLERVEKSANHQSQANGSLMRISPLAIWGHSLPPALLLEYARQDSRLTHPNKVCQDSCGVFCVAIAYAISKGASPKEVYEYTLSFAEGKAHDPAEDRISSSSHTQTQGVAHCLSCGRTFDSLHTESLFEVRVCDEVISTLKSARTSPPVYDYQSGWVLIALQNAFYRLLHSPDFMSGVSDTVMEGGDTDTNGCIAGALLGAVYGRDSIPYQWVQSVLTCRPSSIFRDMGIFRDAQGIFPEIINPRPRAFWVHDALELAEELATLTICENPGNQ